jgi:hypothetical protein
MEHLQIWGSDLFYVWEELFSFDDFSLSGLFASQNANFCVLYVLFNTYSPTAILYTHIQTKSRSTQILPHEQYLYMILWDTAGKHNCDLSMAVLSHTRIALLGGRDFGTNSVVNHTLNWNGNKDFLPLRALPFIAVFKKDHHWSLS